MPPGVFWGAFLSLTWFHLFAAITSWDLWWHLSSGRFLVENGFYPPTDTFSFTSVVPDDQNSNSKSWLGDIILYLIHRYLFGEVGLQAFAAAIQIFDARMFIYAAGNRYNIWTLAGAVLVNYGTIQMHLIKNELFALIIIPVIVLLWIRIQTARRTQASFALSCHLLVMEPASRQCACRVWAHFLFPCRSCHRSSVVQRRTKAWLVEALYSHPGNLFQLFAYCGADMGSSLANPVQQYPERNHHINRLKQRG
jgi:hypothetical protein